MKRWTKCTECGGRGIVRKVVSNVDNGDGSRTATFGDVECSNCGGSGAVCVAQTKLDLLKELNADEFGKLIAKYIPYHTCPKEVREIWFSLLPSIKGDAYEEAWIQWLLSPAKGPMEQCR